MLVILDKDGTLVEPAHGGSGTSFNQWVEFPEDQRLLPGVAERIAELKAMGATLVIASNQGGVAAGHKSLESAIAELKYACELAGVEAGYLCPDFEGEICYKITASSGFNFVAKFIGEFEDKNFRKPNGGMLSLAFESDSGGEGDAVMIGDRPEDQKAAEAAGIRFVDAQSWRDGSVSILPDGAMGRSRE